MSNSCKKPVMLLLLPLQSQAQASQTSGNKTLAPTHSLLWSRSWVLEIREGGGILRATHPRG